MSFKDVTKDFRAYSSFFGYAHKLTTPIQAPVSNVPVCPPQVLCGHGCIDT